MSKTEKVEEGDDAHSSSEEEHGHDHDHVHDQNCDHDNKDGKKGNKGEKKFKKAMSKMGLKPVSGINRVTLKKGKAFTMSIDDPDVWKSPGAQNAYVIFGKPNIDGMGAGQNQMSQFSNPINPEGVTTTKPQGKEQKKTQTTKVEQSATDDLSEEGLSPQNIKMVMEYGKCSKAEAIRLLRETNNDSVNAIMKLDKSSN